MSEGNEEWLQMGIDWSIDRLWWANVLKLDCGDGCTNVNICKKHCIIHFKWVNCVIYGLCINKAVKTDPKQKKKPATVEGFKSRTNCTILWRTALGGNDSFIPL